MSEKLQSRENLHPSPEIAVVTGTFYPNWYEGAPTNSQVHPDKLRGDLALETIKAAQQNGFLISIIDGGSSDKFLQTLDMLKLKGNVLWANETPETPEERQKRGGGQGLARRQGVDLLQMHKDIKVIMQTEPEKISMVGDWLKVAAQPILKGEADIVIPRRTKESFTTYPSYQAQQEQRSNSIYNKILRSRGLLKKEDPDLDLWFGPKIFAYKPEIKELFNRTYTFFPSKTALHKKVRPDAYSNPLMFPVVEALYQGKAVKSVEVNYKHPQAQTRLESGNKEFDQKRKTQQRIIVTELLHLIKLKEKKKNRLNLNKAKFI